MKQIHVFTQLLVKVDEENSQVKAAAGETPVAGGSNDQENIKFDFSVSRYNCS